MKPDTSDDDNVADSNTDNESNNIRKDHNYSLLEGLDDTDLPVLERWDHSSEISVNTERLGELGKVALYLEEERSTVRFWGRKSLVKLVLCLENWSQA